MGWGGGVVGLDPRRSSLDPERLKFGLLNLVQGFCGCNYVYTDKRTKYM